MVLSAFPTSQTGNLGSGKWSYLSGSHSLIKSRLCAQEFYIPLKPSFQLLSPAALFSSASDTDWSPPEEQFTCYVVNSIAKTLWFQRFVPESPASVSPGEIRNGHSEILPFAATWVDLEMIVQSEMSGTGDISHDIPYMWNLKTNVANELIYKIQTDSQT